MLQQLVDVAYCRGMLAQLRLGIGKQKASQFCDRAISCCGSCSGVSVPTTITPLPWTNRMMASSLELLSCLLLPYWVYGRASCSQVCSGLSKAIRHRELRHRVHSDTGLTVHAVDVHWTSLIRHCFIHCGEQRLRCDMRIRRWQIHLGGVIQNARLDYGLIGAAAE